MRIYLPMECDFGDCGGESSVFCSVGEVLGFFEGGTWAFDWDGLVSVETLSWRSLFPVADSVSTGTCASLDIERSCKD